MYLCKVAVGNELFYIKKTSLFETRRVRRVYDYYTFTIIYLQDCARESGLMYN